MLDVNPWVYTPAQPRTVREIAEEFFLRSLEVPGVPPDLACLAGIEILRQQGLIGLAPSSAADTR